MDAYLGSMLSSFSLKVPGASEEDLAALAAALGATPPADLVRLLREFDGAAGRIGNRPLELWSARRIAAEMQEQDVSQAVPGLLLVGSDGGTEALGWLPRLPHKPWGRISLFAGSAREFEPLAASLADLLDALAHGR